MLKDISSENFRERLAELGVSQIEFARLVGVHENSVSNWATGKEVVPGPVRRCLMLLRFSHTAYLGGLDRGE